MEASDVRENGSDSDDWAIVDEDSSSQAVSGSSKYVFRGDISDGASNRAAGEVSDGESIEIVPDDRDIDTMEVVSEAEDQERPANEDSIQVVLEDGTTFAEDLPQEAEAGPSSVLTSVESRHRARLSERDHWDLVAILMVALVGGFAVGYFCGSAGIVRRPGGPASGDVVQSLRAEIRSLRASLRAVQPAPESAGGGDTTELPWRIPLTTAAIEQLYEDFSSFQCRWQNECLQEKNGAFCLARKNKYNVEQSQKIEATDDFILIGKKSHLSELAGLPELGDKELKGDEVAPLSSQSVGELTIGDAEVAGVGSVREGQILMIEELRVPLGTSTPITQEDSSLENKVRPDFILKPEVDYGFVHPREETNSDVVQGNRLRRIISSKEDAKPDFNQKNDPEYFISKQEGMRHSSNWTLNGEDLSKPTSNKRSSAFTLKPDHESELSAQLRQLARLVDRLAPGASLSALAAVEASTRALAPDPRLAHFESRAAQQTAKLVHKLESFERKLAKKIEKRLGHLQKEIVEEFCKVRKNLGEGTTEAFRVCVDEGRKGKGGRDGVEQGFEKRVMAAGGEEIVRQKNWELKAFQNHKAGNEKRKRDVKEINKFDSKESHRDKKNVKNFKIENKQEGQKVSFEKNTDAKKESPKYEKTFEKHLKKELRKEEIKVSAKKEIDDRRDSSKAEKSEKHLKNESRNEEKSVNEFVGKKESAKPAENNKPWTKENKKMLAKDDIEEGKFQKHGKTIKPSKHEKTDKRLKKENEKSEKRLADEETETKKSPKKLWKNGNGNVKKSQDHVKNASYTKEHRPGPKQGGRCEKDARKRQRGEPEPCSTEPTSSKRSHKPKGDSGLRHEACDGRKPENVSWVLEMGRGRQASRSTASQSDWVFDRAAARQSHRSDKPKSARRKWTDKIFPERVLAVGRKVKEVFREMHEGIKERAHNWR